MTHTRSGFAQAAHRANRRIPSLLDPGMEGTEVEEIVNRAYQEASLEAETEECFVSTSPEDARRILLEEEGALEQANAGTGPFASDVIEQCKAAVRRAHEEVERWKHPRMLLTDEEGGDICGNIPLELLEELVAQEFIVECQECPNDEVHTPSYGPHRMWHLNDQYYGEHEHNWRCVERALQTLAPPFHLKLTFGTLRYEPTACEECRAPGTA